MKIEKKHYIIIGVIVAIVLIWYFFLRKKNGGDIASKIGFGRAITHGSPDQAEIDKIKADKTKQKLSESSFRGHGGGGRHGHHGGHGGRGWGGRGWGYGGGWWGYPWPYYEYDDPIVLNSPNCPPGEVWRGAIIGCVKP